MRSATGHARHVCPRAHRHARSFPSHPAAALSLARRAPACGWVMSGQPHSIIKSFILSWGRHRRTTPTRARRPHRPTRPLNACRGEAAPLPHRHPGHGRRRRRWGIDRETMGGLPGLQMPVLPSVLHLLCLWQFLLRSCLIIAGSATLAPNPRPPLVQNARRLSSPANNHNLPRNSPALCLR